MFQTVPQAASILERVWFAISYYHIQLIDSHILEKIWQIYDCVTGGLHAKKTMTKNKKATTKKLSKMRVSESNMSFVLHSNWIDKCIKVCANQAQWRCIDAISSAVRHFALCKAASVQAKKKGKKPRARASFLALKWVPVNPAGGFPGACADEGRQKTAQKVSGMQNTICERKKFL